MNGTILFPYNAKSTSPFAYYYAIELAKKTNHNLIVISTYQPSDLNKSFFRRNKTDENIELKKQIHLKLLELNGHYFEKYNQWGKLDEIKIKCLLRSGTLEDVLYNLIKHKSSRLLLVDSKTFSEELFSSSFINNIRSLDFKLWVMPLSIEGFRTKPELTSDNFNLDKKEIFGECFSQTKLYNIPNDLNILKSDFKTYEPVSCYSINKL
jgi:hypothetical protein